MARKNKRFQANRFSPLDTDLGFQHTAKGMSQDVYESESRLRSPVVLSPAGNSPESSTEYATASANDHFGYQRQASRLNPSVSGSVKYSLEFLLQYRRDLARQQAISAVQIGAGPGIVPIAGHDDVRTSLDVLEGPIRSGTFPYASLPFELRQMVLRELVPTKSIWNGTSFPKSCPKRYQQAYFEKTKYLQNRALAH